MQREQAAAGRGHQFFELGAGGLDALAGPRQLGDQLRGEPAAGLARDVARADRGQQVLGLRGGQELLRPAGKQLQQQPVQAVDRLRAGHAQLITPVGQEPQRHRRIIGGNHPQARAVQPGQRHRMRTGRIGFPPLAGREHPGPGRQLRWHTGHRLAISDQALREVAADPVAALHRPDTVLELAARGQHRPVTVPVSTKPAPEQHLPPVIDTLDRRRALVWIHPDNHVPHVLHPHAKPGPLVTGEEGNATSSWADPS